MIQLDLYLDQITNFLRTVTIKNTYFANMIKNKTIHNRGIASLSDEINPYYMNLLGEYTLEDIPITILSIDDGSSVVLSRDLIINHPKTASLYKLPNTRYITLCSQYSKQTDLIKSIVYPISSNIDVYKANNYDLLGYDCTLLATNEQESMIECLTTTIKLFQTRWDVKEYVTEEYYPVVAWSSLWYALYINLLTQRIKNLRTRSVHPYHIWEYLQSKGLKDYRSVLNNDQQIFLYKNINYLLKNKGKNSNLRILSEELLYPYGVSLNTKTIILNTEDSIDNCISLPTVISEDLYSTTTPTQNYITNGYETIDKLVIRMYNDDLKISKSPAEIDKVKTQFSKADKTYITTKLVELKKIPINNRYENMFYKFIVQSLVYGYTQQQISYYISIVLPLSNTYKTFEIGEAIALMNYCINKENGITLIDIPNTCYLDSVYKIPQTDIIKTFTHKGKTLLLDSFLNTDVMLKAIKELSVKVTSSLNFIKQYDAQFSIFKSAIQELEHSGDLMFHKALYEFYQSVTAPSWQDIDLVPGYTTYEDWFNDNIELRTSIDLHDISIDSKSAYNVFGTTLIEEVTAISQSFHILQTGLNIEQYDKMKALFTQLCSYNIAFLDTDRNSISTSLFVPIILDEEAISNVFKDCTDYIFDTKGGSTSNAYNDITIKPYLEHTFGLDSYMSSTPDNPISYTKTHEHYTTHNIDVLRSIITIESETMTTHRSDIPISLKY